MPLPTRMIVTATTPLDVANPAGSGPVTNSGMPGWMKWSLIGGAALAAYIIIKRRNAAK